MKHIIESQAFTLPYLDCLFTNTDKISEMVTSKKPEVMDRLCGFLRHKQIFIPFYQSSTRTILSFESAGKVLGAHVLKTENAGAFSSAAKGETLEHSIRMLCELGADAIILRHNERGSAKEAADVCNKYYPDTSVINAGDGDGQHPTQSLIDLYTLRQTIRPTGKEIKDLTVVIGGDLAHSRTTHSLTYLLSKFSGVKMIFVAPEDFRMARNIIDHLVKHNVGFKEVSSIAEAFPLADAVYWVRPQKEYHHDNNKTWVMKGEDKLHITNKEMALLRPNVPLLHPLPIVDEIAREVDDHPQAVYFRQVKFGRHLRMALLCDIFEINI